MKSVEKFRDINRDYSFRFFSTEQQKNFMKEVYGGSDIYNIYNRAKFGPLKADIWRYCVLLDRGGVYCDIGKGIDIPLRHFIKSDTQGLISFEQNVTNNQVTAAAAQRVRYPDRRVINWAFAFKPKHPLLRLVVSEIVRSYPLYAGRAFKDPKLAILELTGPIQLTNCVHLAAESGDLDELLQVSIDFEGHANTELPGSYVRYVTSPSYVTQRNCVIIE